MLRSTIANTSNFFSRLRSTSLIFWALNSGMTWAYLKFSKPSMESRLLASAITTGPLNRGAT